MTTLPTRLAARVLLVDEERRVLLIRSVDPDGAVFWYPPGGGVEPGEEPAAAAMREVWEETGLQGVRLDGEVWRRRHLFKWGATTHDQSESWFLARVANFEPEPGALTPAEVDEITEFRWWSLSDLEATDELLTPRALPSLLRELLATGVPAEPIDVGV